jgi:hypothetical protein
MGAAATAPARPRAGHERSLRREGGCRPEPGRATLNDRISALWTLLAETGAGECPVCAADIVAGTPCRTCGSELS